MAKKKIEEEKLYQIKNLSENQVRILVDALEMYTRLGLLQFDKVVDHLFSWKRGNISGDGYIDNRDEIQRMCFAIKDLIVSKDDELKKYPKQSHWSLGIGSPKTSKDALIAYELESDIKKVIIKNLKGRLDLTDELPVVVSEMNLREEKLREIIEKMKDK